MLILPVPTVFQLLLTSPTLSMIPRLYWTTLLCYCSPVPNQAKLPYYYEWCNPRQALTAYCPQTLTIPVASYWLWPQPVVCGPVCVAWCANWGADSAGMTSQWWPTSLPMTANVYCHYLLLLLFDHYSFFKTPPVLCEEGWDKQPCETLQLLAPAHYAMILNELHLTAPMQRTGNLLPHSQWYCVWLPQPNPSSVSFEHYGHYYL